MKRKGVEKRSTKNMAAGVYADGLPIKTRGGALVLSLGKIVHNRSGFSTKRYIYPTGFRSSRVFPSLEDGKNTTTYISSILDRKDEWPTFRVTPLDYPNRAIEGPNPTRVWVEMLRKIRRRDNLTISGPQMFGIDDAEVTAHIKKLKDANKCKRNGDNVWRKAPTTSGSSAGK